MSDETVDTLLRHHAQAVASAPSVHRGGSHESWRLGVMVPIGSRIPQGGRPGDAYASYGYMSAETPEQIDILFDQAEVADFYFILLF